MKKLYLLAPVNSIHSAKTMVKAGADEFFATMDVPGLKNLTFTVRTKNCHGGVKTCVSKSDFSEIVKIAHDANIKVNLVANIPTLKRLAESGNNHHKLDMSSLYLDMVQKGKDLGADALIVGGITPLLIIKEAGINLPIHAGTFFNVFNPGQVSFLKYLGVKRITHPFNISIEDIRKLSASGGIEHEVFGHFSCSSVNGLCLLTHLTTEELTTYMSCGNKYDVRSTFCDLNNHSFLNLRIECSICSLSELIDLNVHSIKIVGRAIPLFMTAPVVKTYRRCIDALYEGASIGELKRDYLSKIPFWSQNYCAHNSCKYISKENLKAEI